MSAVAGYFLSNDVSERVFQIERAGQWTKGKGCETFGPIGPWVVTKDEIKDPQNLNIWLKVNGEFRQKGNTKTMVFGVAEIVWWCSQYFIMEPGDIIVTGTPSGVALGMKPSRNSSTSATWSSSAATGSARRSRRSSRRAPDCAHAGDQNKSPGPRPGASVCASVRTTRSVSGEDRAGELVVQAGANDVFLEADVGRQRRGAGVEAAEIDIEIFDLGGPIAEEGVFETGADGPADWLLEKKPLRSLAALRHAGAAYGDVERIVLHARSSARPPRSNSRLLRKPSDFPRRRSIRRPP